MLNHTRVKAMQCNRAMYQLPAERNVLYNHGFYITAEVKVTRQNLKCKVYLVYQINFVLQTRSNQAIL